MQQVNRHLNGSTTSRVILLVEDHEIYRDVVRAALGRYLPDYEMLAAASVADALGVLESSPVDVLVADMTLPDGSAVDLVERARRHVEGGMRVIVFSSHSSADMMPVLSRDDVHGYVAKEQGLKALAQAIEETQKHVIGGQQEPPELKREKLAAAVGTI